jgi:protein TonB
MPYRRRDFVLLLALCLVVSGALGIASQNSLDATPPAQTQLPNRVRVSQGVTQGLLIKKVSPKYPSKARNNRVQGTVVLKAVISTSGDITELNVLSGDELLVPSALKAVKQWKYRPYMLQGHPVEIDTQITVNYTLTQ